MCKSTMVEFVDELKKLPPSKEVNYMIEEALAGEYHDYKNRKYVCGKMGASRRLRALNYVELAERIENGEFDENMDDEDKEAMCRDLEQLSDSADRLKTILNLDDE